MDRLRPQKGDVFPISDALGIDVKYVDKLHKLAGTVEVLIPTDPTLKFTARILDSIVDIDSKRVAVIAHAVGSLYLVALHEVEKRSMDMYVVDGVEAELTPKLKDVAGVLGMRWSRTRFYEAILPGIKAAYWRDIYSHEWQTLDWKKKSDEYFARKNTKVAKVGG